MRTDLQTEAQRAERDKIFLREYVMAGNILTIELLRHTGRCKK